MRRRGGVLTRLLHLGDRPVVVHAWQPEPKLVMVRAAAAGPEPAGAEELELAIERVRFALGVDEDLGEFYDAFRTDPLVGPAVRRRPWLRPRRRPWPWEALAWAVTEQLIEVSRAAEIQRRIVRRWGAELRPPASSASRPGAGGSAAEATAPWTGPGPLRDVPGPAVIAGCAPAELDSMDLAPARSIALVRCAREVAAGRADLSSSDCERRLLAIPEIGPWTVRCLGLFGRGDPDALPAGDLAYVKLIGHLGGLGRRATVEEVEEYFAPYEPYRGLAASFALSLWARRWAPARPRGWQPSRPTRLDGHGLRALGAGPQGAEGAASAGETLSVGDLSVHDRPDGRKRHPKSETA
jgi:3-methyladenine DNA glycosylase/8-oxoguanine DNA glycosylase